MHLLDTAQGARIGIHRLLALLPNSRSSLSSVCPSCWIIDIDSFVLCCTCPFQYAADYMTMAMYSTLFSHVLCMHVYVSNLSPITSELPKQCNTGIVILPAVYIQKQQTPPPVSSAPPHLLPIGHPYGGVNHQSPCYLPPLITPSWSLLFHPYTPADYLPLLLIAVFRFLFSHLLFLYFFSLFSHIFSFLPSRIGHVCFFRCVLASL